MNTVNKVSGGLFAAWAVHDLEELYTIVGTSKQLFPRMSKWLPLPPRLRSEGVSQTHVNVALSIMAVLVALAAAEGKRTGGASALFRGALLAFGLHGFTHILTAVIAGRYTAGVATSPIIVIPYWIYARRALRAEGLRDNDLQAIAIAVLVLPVLILVHVVAWFLTK